VRKSSLCKGKVKNNSPIMKNASQEIAKQIKSARISAGFSQEKLSEKLGISKRTLIKYENGESDISASDLFKISNYCNVDLGRLIGAIKSGVNTIPIEDAEAINAPHYSEFRIEASVPAGIAAVQERSGWYESEILDYDPRSHFFLQIDEEYGYSMMPLIEPGDLVLVSMTAKAKSGNIVAAKWDETKGAIKIFSESKDLKNVALLSYNPSVTPIFLERNEVKIYKVVLIKKMT
jgi:repressor LexA